MTLDPYKTLGLKPQDVSPETVRRAFKAKMSEAHPDREGGSAELMVELNQARDILSNPDRRQRYDETGSAETGQATIEEQALMIIGNLFALAVNADSQMPASRLAGVVLVEIRKGMNTALESQRKMPEVIRRMKGLMKKIGGDPLLKEAIAKRVARLEREMQEVNQQILVGELMLKTMKSLKFNQ